jgi:hypothetical protein
MHARHRGELDTSVNPPRHDITEMFCDECGRYRFDRTYSNRGSLNCRVTREQRGFNAECRRSYRRLS